MSSDQARDEACIKSGWAQMGMRAPYNSGYDAGRASSAETIKILTEALERILDADGEYADQVIMKIDRIASEALKRVREEI